MRQQNIYSRVSRTKAARKALWAIVFVAVVLARSAGALTINLTFAPDANFASAGLNATDINNMKAACTYTATQFTSRYSDPININIKVTASAGTSDFGSSTAFFTPVDTYNNLRAAFVADSKTADDATTVGSGGARPARAVSKARATPDNRAQAPAQALAPSTHHTPTSSKLPLRAG